MALGRVITSGMPLSNPLPDTPIQGGSPHTKDTFSIASATTIVGRATNNDPGLNVQAWQGTGNALAISNGGIVRGTSTESTWSNQISAPVTAGAYVYITLEQLPTTIGLYLDLYRHTVSGAPNGYRIEFTKDGIARLMHRAGGTSLYHGDVPVAPGDRVGLRWLNGTLSLVVNEVIKVSLAIDVITRQGHAGLSGLTATTGFKIQDFTLCLY